MGNDVVDHVKAPLKGLLCESACPNSVSGEISVKPSWKLEMWLPSFYKTINNVNVFSLMTLKRDTNSHFFSILDDNWFEHWLTTPVTLKKHFPKILEEDLQSKTYISQG